MHPTIVSWLAALAIEGKSQLTLDAYRRALRHFVHWFENTGERTFTPSAVIPRDVNDWKAHQQVKERARPNTINQRIAAITSFFTWAAAHNLTKTNPAAHIKQAATPPLAPKALPENETRALLRAVTQHGDMRDIAIIETLLGTGLRVQELIDLQLHDLTLTERSGNLTVRRGKKQNYREIPLSKNVRTALAAWLEQRGDTPGALWHGQRGDLQSRATINKLLTKYSRLAALEEIPSPHDLRHTFATRYLEENPGDLRGLAALLGHSSVNTTMIYTQPTTDSLATRLENL